MVLIITCFCSMISDLFEFDGTKEWKVFRTSRTSFAYFRLYLLANVCKRMITEKEVYKKGGHLAALLVV